MWYGLSIEKVRKWKRTRNMGVLLFRCAIVRGCRIKRVMEKGQAGSWFEISCTMTRYWVWWWYIALCSQGLVLLRYDVLCVHICLPVINISLIRRIIMGTPPMIRGDLFGLDVWCLIRFNTIDDAIVTLQNHLILENIEIDNGGTDSSWSIRSLLLYRTKVLDR